MSSVYEIDYSSAKYPVRSDFAAGHSRYWQRLAAPGNWLTGEQRVDVAKEVRQAKSCELCATRKASLSPNVRGIHDTATSLSDAIVEVVHRVVTDPNRLTKTWFEGIMEAGLKPEEYIEVLGILVHVLLIDEFCRGIGEPLNELPEPLAGEPSRYLPSNTVDAGAWVRMLPNSIESGPEADLDGKFHGNVIRALSLVPDDVRTLIDLLEVHYLTNDDIVDMEAELDKPLNRVEMEVVATRVSSFNDCFY